MRRRYSVEDIRQNFRLEGEEVYRTSSGKRVVPRDDGYTLVGFGPAKERITIRLHVIKYALAHGWIPHEVDHADGNPANGLLENLRAASHQQNMRNRRPTPRDLPLGVARKRNRYRAYLDGKHLGTFKTVEEASSVVNNERDRRHGEFSSLRRPV